MKNLIIYLCVISFFSFSFCGYNASKEDTLIKVKDYKTYSYKVSSVDTNSIGYPTNEEYEIGPNALTIDSNYVYFVDIFFGTIVKIDLETGVMNKSYKLQDVEQPWLRDLAILNDKIYVTSDLNRIYLFNKNLVIEDTIITESNQKYFVGKKEDCLIVYYMNSDRMVLLNKSNQILDYKNEIPNYLGTYKGDSYELITKDNVNCIKTRYGTLTLKESYKDITNYDALNLAFNSERLVYFYVNKSGFNLYSYKY